jgi:hypothetical protein
VDGGRHLFQCIDEPRASRLMISASTT